MHSQLRRLPAERARHAKRLGHVMPVFAAQDEGPNAAHSTSSPADKAASTSTKASTTADKTTASVSAKSTPATSSSGTVTTTSLTTSSASTSPLSSSTPIINTPSLKPSTAPSTSVQVVPASPSANPNSDAANSGSTSKGLSGGAIGAIVALSSIVGVALLVFFIRKTYLRRRQKRRVSWGNTNLFTPPPQSTSNFSDFTEKPPTRSPSGLVNHTSPTPMSPFEAHGQSVYANVAPVQQMPPQSPYANLPPPPPASYNNPVNRAYSPHPPALAPAGANANAVVGMARVAAGVPTSAPTPPPKAPAAPARVANDAIVKCTFIPTLPDELSITTGERVRLLASYDDGWALCANARGEQGMVPQECLERAVQEQPMYQDQTDWRNMRRASSLNPDGRQF
ncbi:hypothetical protein BV22DRAFT_575061 [Leucogyrophana mollusca]|uniref:Uncharacterized protein n=1 Tax=Leucogyrophana mollusca TaxID=85980 RepID=A0ACB8BD32_9AGAM|nr:hypothetical protein BV22DRAFT_575061 [Leucogyrophana mollusca]